MQPDRSSDARYLDKTWLPGGFVRLVAVVDLTHVKFLG